jgi:hypothetical protein
LCLDNKPCIDSCAFDGDYIGNLESLYPVAFERVSVSSFQYFCTAIKGYVHAIQKTALKNNLELIAIRKTKKFTGGVQNGTYEAKDQGKPSRNVSDVKNASAGEDDSVFASDTDFLLDKGLGDEIDRLSEGKDGAVSCAQNLVRLRT